jgi:predicted porin
MRKLLLVSTATLGVAAAANNTVLAQTATQWTTQGVPTVALPVQAANNANNISPVMQQNGIANPMPGTIVIHFNGRVEFGGVGEWSSLDKIKGVGAANTGAAKLDPITTVGFVRLYSGMDAIATNGLRYGASIELRQDFAPVSGSTANSGSSANTSSNTIFVRRAFVYAAGDRFGIVRMGQGDGVIGIFDNGVTTFQNFDTGGWDGDFSGSIPSNANLTFPFPALQGAEYGSSKFVYLSPQLLGFDFGFAYAPNSGDLQDGQAINSLTPAAATLTTCAVAASGCQALSSSSVALDGSRFRNETQTGLRYQGVVGPVGIDAFGIYVNSGHVNVSPAVLGSQFQGQSYGDLGLALSYAGFTVGGHLTTGAYNGVNGLKPQGGANATAWLVGAQYATGPLTFGASYYDYTSQGSPLTVGIAQRREQGFAAGSNYTLAPGLVLYLSYLYGLRHQGDFDFATSTTGSTNNNIKTQLIALGTVVKW